MSQLKKRKRLTYQEKYKLLEEVKSGVSKQSILQKYGICGDRTYRHLLSCESDIRNKVMDNTYVKKKSSKTSDNMILDAAVLKWFNQARDRGDPISGPIIQEKALILNLILNEKLDGSKTFKASDGWVQRFKARHGIPSFKLKGEKLFKESVAVAEFAKTLKAKIKSENLNLDNIYNADEAGILWRLLTACTLALYEEELEASGRKEYKDRVTALFCANATGSHRIPLLTIGKSKRPQCLNNLITKNVKDLRLKNLQSLGVIYTYQSSAWMDTDIFMLWYKNEFIPRVLEHQRKSGITGKVVLLLDNAPPHPSLNKLNAINENFEVVYLLPNVAAFFQPMAQGVIETTKKLCKKNLLRRLLLSEKSEGATKFLKELNLRDYFEMLSLAWADVKSSTLQKVWKLLLGNSFILNSVLVPSNIQDPLFNIKAEVDELESPTDLISFPNEICDQVSELFSGPDYSVERSREFLLKWFENNDQHDTDCGWEPLSESDIVNLVTNSTCKPEITPEITPEIEKSEVVFENPEPMETTSSEAFDCLMKFKNWLKSRAECLPKHLDYIEEFENVITENVRLALVQLSVGDNKTENISRAISFIERAKKRGADIVTLPECFSSPCRTAHFPKYAETIPNGETCNALSEAAKKNEVYVIGGTITEKDGDKLYNTVTIWDPQGKLIAKYRQIHLLDINIKGKITFRQSDFLSPGDWMTTFEVKGCKIGIGVCHDIRFEQHARLYRNQGCQMLIYPGAFNMTTGPLHWSLLQRSRANDLQCYVACVAPARPIGTDLLGFDWAHTQLTNPWGTILQELEEHEDMIVENIDLKLVEKVRSNIPVFDQRRIDLYDTIWKKT